MEQKLLEFLSTNESDKFVKINEALKSFFPVPERGMPKPYLSQRASYDIKNMLDKLVADGKIFLEQPSSNRLGGPYYPDTTTMKTEYYSIDDVPIYAKKA